MSKQTTKSGPVQAKRKQNYTFEHIFTPQELEEKSKQLAKACEDRSHIEDKKKSIMSSLKAQIDEKTAEINILSGHINTGMQYKTESCDVMLDFDKGKKILMFDGKAVGMEKLTGDDHQLEIV